LERRRILVERSVTDVDGHLVFGSPKTHQHRTVPVPRFVADMLARHVAGRATDALVFPSPEGAVLRANNFRRRSFDRAAVAAGLPGLTPHELRHTAASLAVSAGANVKAVQRMLGHASAAMTLDVYTDLFEDDLDAVANRLDGLRADSVRTSDPRPGPARKTPTAKRSHDLAFRVVPSAGFEPATPALGERCSIP
jgi:integrase